MSLAILLLALVRQSSSAVPSAPVPLNEVEIRLSFLGGTGGCLGRCIRYHATVRGDGSVRYEDVGNEPRDPARQRTIPVEDVVTLVNEFLRAQFLDAADRYPDAEPIATREGDLMRFREQHGIDGGIWDLTFRAGKVTKTIRLNGSGTPSQLLRLRQAIEGIAGVPCGRVPCASQR
jgi:hypothetical protein